MENTGGLYVDSVAHRFGVRRVLSSVHLSCMRGEVVGLLGRNGSGKSTLLKVIFGTIRAHYQYCLLDGVRFTEGFRTKNIAYLPQHYLISADIRVSRAVEDLVNIHLKQVKEIPVIVAQWNRRMGELSGGVRRLIETLLILYSDADYVLLDEPFSNISPLLIEEISEHILALKTIKGFIVTDHYYKRILEISDRLVLLNNGCNYRIESPDDLITYGYLPDSDTQ